MSELDDVFSDPAQRTLTAAHARTIMADTSTTIEQYSAMQKILALMYLHYPEDCTKSLMVEAESRRIYFLKIWSKNV